MRWDFEIGLKLLPSIKKLLLFYVFIFILCKNDFFSLSNLINTRWFGLSISWCTYVHAHACARSFGYCGVETRARRKPSLFQTDSQPSINQSILFVIHRIFTLYRDLIWIIIPFFDSRWIFCTNSTVRRRRHRHCRRIRRSTLSFRFGDQSRFFCVRSSAKWRDDQHQCKITKNQ